MAPSMLLPVRVLDQFQVSPPPDSVPDSSLPLTFFDIYWLNVGPVERLFFYPYTACSTAHFVAHLLPNLISSLSLTLKHFYPLAGRVTPSPDSSPDAPKLEIRYRAGEDSIPLTLAECSSADLQQLSGDNPREVRELYPLVPQLPRSNSTSTHDGEFFTLLALQVTVFPAQGICVGLAIRHVACDGKSSMHFMKAWSAACKSELASQPLPSTSPLPFHDRTMVGVPTGLCSKILGEIMRAPKPTPPSPYGGELAGVVIASFSLGREQIERLKQRVLATHTAKANHDVHAVPIHCSGFVVACASAWTCLNRARGGWESKKRAHMFFPVELRGRLEPPLPAEYFGNCLRPCFVEVDMGDLMKEEDGVSSAAVAIGRAIKGLDDGAVMAGAEGWLRKVVSLLPEKPMSVAGSPKYRVYDTDFGWGAPSKVEVMSLRPGGISLAESRKEQGGIEIGLMLPMYQMEEFTSCFTNGPN